MKPKIAIVTSKGGHLYQIMRLKHWWNKYDRFFVTLPGLDSESVLENERVYFGFSPETRSITNAMRHLFQAVSILRRERPTIMVSSGAGIAAPYFLVAKCLGIRTIFIEVFDRVDHPSLTGRLVRPIADFILIQHKHQKNWYPRSVYKGAIV